MPLALNELPLVKPPTLSTLIHTPPVVPVGNKESKLITKS
jgi:hypothetical protein